MDTKFNYFIVGFFVLFFTCLLLIWGAWLFSTGKGKTYNTYLVYMDDSVAGLNINSPVKYNGVDVGYVAEIALDKKEPQRVRLLLKIERNTPINAGTTATMITQGLTGIGYVGLKMQALKLGPLQTPAGEEYPVIKSTPSLFFRLDASLTKLIHSLEDISDKINTLLTPEVSQSISNTIHNVDRITSTVAKQDLGKIDIILENGAKTSQELTPLITKLNESATDIQRLTNQLAANPAALLRGQQPPPSGPGE